MAKLGTVLRSLGFCPTEVEVGEMQASLGATLDFEALKGCIAKANEKTPSSDELLEALKAFDHSGSGTIRTADLKCVVRASCAQIFAAIVGAGFLWVVSGTLSLFALSMVNSADLGLASSLAAAVVLAWEQEDPD